MAISGPTFLLLYIVLLAAAGIVSAIVPRALRPQGRVLDRPDPETLAWLSGSSGRLHDAIVARHPAAGDLMMHGPAASRPPTGARWAGRRSSAIMRAWRRRWSGGCAGKAWC